jgi:hypothetical protein
MCAYAFLKDPAAYLSMIGATQQQVSIVLESSWLFIMSRLHPTINHITPPSIRLVS